MKEPPKETLLLTAPPAAIMSGAFLRKDLNEFGAVVIVHPGADLRAIALALLAEASNMETQ